MATTLKYCTHAELKELVPYVSKFQSKEQIFNWKMGVEDIYDTSLDIYYASGCGLVNQLYFNGSEVNKISYVLTTSSALGSAITGSATGMSVESGSAFGALDLVKVDNEYMKITAVSTNDLVMTGPLIVRGLFDTSATHHAEDTLVYRIIDASADIGDASSQGADALTFLYDEDLDLCMLITNSVDPNDNLVEAGTDWETLVGQQLANATMELNSMLDSRFPIPIPKTFQYATDKSSSRPEYDFILKKATAYLAGANLIRANNPEDERGQALYDMVTNVDGTGIVDKINKAEIKLRFEIDQGDSTGEIIEAVRNGTMYLVETYCESWSGEPYDKVEIVCGIGDGGVYGTAKIDIKTLDADNLSGHTKSDVIVTGGLQEIVNGLYVRFEGNSMTAGDKWFIPVRRKGLQTTNSAVKSINVRPR